MKFIVNFIATGPITPPYFGGLKALDQARTMFGPGVMPEQMVPIRKTAGYQYTAEVPERTARESGHFKNNWEINVEFVPQLLGPELYQFSVEKIGDDQYKPIVRLDQAKVIEAWKQAGYPLKWGFDEAADE